MDEIIVQRFDFSAAFNEYKNKSGDSATVSLEKVGRTELFRFVVVSDVQLL